MFSLNQLVVNFVKLSVISLFVCLMICDRSAVDSAVFKSPNLDDAQFWRKNAENYLKTILGNQKSEQFKAKNVIIFLGDGMGMASITAGRIFKGQKNGNSGEEANLAFDLFPNTGLARTYNTDKQVPDSAGTATALFTGVKTKYRVVGADSTITETNIETSKLESIMNWAQKEGKRTGIVTNTRITHATPAATYAHIMHRDWECDTLVPQHLKTKLKDIARQLVEEEPGNKFNVILGGARNCFGAADPDQLKLEFRYNGSAEKTCIRQDGMNLVTNWLASKANTKSQYIKNTGQLLDADVDNLEHLLGLFADNHMSYDVIRDKSVNGEPSLSQMTQQAIRVLQRKDSQGFVLMVEGGRIDQAHHQNHAYLALNEVYEFDKAVQTALNMTNRQETLIIVTADHSHALTFNGYPERGNDILGFGNKPGVLPYETLTYANGPGFNTHRLSKETEDQGRYGTWAKVEEFGDKRKEPTYRHMAAFPLEDETHGGEDVPVYGIGPGSTLIRGAFEQNYIGYIVSYAGCIGPVKSWNSACNDKSSSSGPSLVSSMSLLTFVLSLRSVF